MVSCRRSRFRAVKWGSNIPRRMDAVSCKRASTSPSFCASASLFTLNWPCARGETLCAGAAEEAAYVGCVDVIGAPREDAEGFSDGLVAAQDLFHRKLLLLHDHEELHACSGDDKHHDRGALNVQAYPF